MKENKVLKFISLVPVSIYAIFFVLFPLIYIFLISFLENDYYGGILVNLTFKNYLAIFDVIYLKVFLKSFIIAIISTFICICISYPFVLLVTRLRKEISNILMTLIMIPFFTNSLIRTYGWIVLLRKNGIINNFLLSTNIISNPLSFIYNNLGIILGMVYTFLPFMILPLYSATEKIDRGMIDASYDLGASKMKTFFKIILPETKSALFNGSLMVFIPIIGCFFITDLLGGGTSMILGNLIKNEFLVSRNWPLGAALSIILLIITFILVRIYEKTGGELDDLGGM